MLHKLIMQYSDDLLASVGLSEEAFSKEARFLLAAKLYEQGRLTSGQAVKFCGKGRVEFLYSVPSAGISISNMPPEDVIQELSFAKHA